MPATNENTPEWIVAKANALARTFYRMMGCVVGEGYAFDRATHPQERMCWQMACEAYEVIEGTPVMDALSEIEDGTANHQRPVISSCEQ